MYETHEEANQKLKATVVLFKKDPVYILEAGGGKKHVTLTFSYLEDQTKQEKKEINETGWNFRDLGSHLGYANFEGGIKRHNEALFLTRMPVRQCSSTQGISQKNLNVPNFRGSHKLGLSPQGLSWNHVYLSKPFLRMLRDDYPDLRTISSQFSKDAWLTSKAFSREFAVRKDDVGPFYLQYKGKDIGYSDDLYRFKISPQFDYLRETMDHINLKVA